MPFGQVNINIPVSIANGGTAGTTAGEARDNLSVSGRFLSIGQTDNLGITYSGNVLSITQANGNALASTAGSQGRVVVPAITAGQQIVLQVTAAQTLQDAGHGTPQILGRWGTTASVAWGSPLPLYIGVVNRDDTDAGLRFFLTRDPTKTTTPASTNNIGIGGTAPSTSSQSNIVLFGTAANTNYNSKPCAIIGSVTATCDNSSGGSWTIGALSIGKDGIGLFNETTMFLMPLGQNGAASGTYFNANGGTAPVFTTNTYYYSVNRAGQIYCNIFLNGDGGADGAGAVLSQIALPYTIVQASSTVGTRGVSGQAVGATTISGATTIVNTFTDGNSYTDLFYLSAATTTSSITNAMFSSGARSIYMTFIYPGFGR